MVVQSTQVALSDPIFSELVDQENLNLLTSSISTGETSTTTTTPSTTSAPSKTCGNESLLDINGVWFCNDDQVQKGTMCQLRCFAGFSSSDIVMKRRCTCTKKGICKWNHKEVECLSNPPSTSQPTTVAEAPTCPVLNHDINSGYWKCSNQNKHGSRCSLLCFSGFEQKNTNRRCKCQGDVCEWRGPDRQCESTAVFTTPPSTFEEVCQEKLEDQFGNWDCTDSNKSNSRCRLTCPVGYQSSAKGARRCRCQAEGLTYNTNLTFITNPILFRVI